MSKSRTRRILGMTASQFFLVACLALGAAGAIFGGLIFISSTGQPSAPVAPPQQSQPQPATSPEPPFDPTLTPTATLVLNENQIPVNWKQYTSSRFEISLPLQAESVNVESERQARIDTYRSQGYGFLADNLESGTFDYRFWFNYPKPEGVAFGIYIVVKEDILPALSLDEYINEAYGENLQGFQVTNRQPFDIPEFEAQRILLEANLNDTPISVADYLITDEVNLWVISCVSSLEDFFVFQAEFDRVARTFRLVY